MREQRRREDELITLTVATLVACEEEEDRHRGSIMGRRVIRRDRYSGYIRLMNDYFVDNPVYPEYYFQRRCLRLYLKLAGLHHILVYNCIHSFCVSGFV